VKFKLVSDYQPSGDQPQAIAKLTEATQKNVAHQVLLGVTGSGKTYTLANTIAAVQRPTLVIAHNKTLAAQLYQEFRDFFPENAVSYFVSYYDYYQPEAYLPQTDTYIEKETDINDEIDKLRLSATTNLLTRPDCIVVASVSCLYNLGSPLEYGKNVLQLVSGQVIDRRTVMGRLVEMQYRRSPQTIERGSFRVLGEVVHLWPAYEENIVKLVFEGEVLKSIAVVDPLNFEPIQEETIKNLTIYPAKHYIAGKQDRQEIFKTIRADLAAQIKALKGQGRMLEAARLEQKVNYDLENIETMGFVNGIENYSRYFDGREPGQPPYTLLDYMKHNAEKFGHDSYLTVLDESHISLPQIRGMYRGDQARKQTLIDYGFRLPSALDNRPLTWTEFTARTPQAIYTSATPTEFEVSLAKTTPNSVHNGVVEQVVRPTGLLDPKIEIRPIEGQVRDVDLEIKKRVKLGQRVLVTVLTKRMAEDLAEYLGKQEEYKVAYLHSEVDTLDRSDILDSLRLGEYDVLIGINLLREGLDLPEVSLVAVLDADKEGFLRSETALMQIMGRAARHVEGQVILYADRKTNSIKKAVAEVRRRRRKQQEYNQKHGISPISISKPVRQKLLHREKEVPVSEAEAVLRNWGWSGPKEVNPEALTPEDKQKLTKKLTQLMRTAAKNWEFEAAAEYRDVIERLRG
jgi:excinuclease ABC subunit B